MTAAWIKFLFFGTLLALAPLASHAMFLTSLTTTPDPTVGLFGDVVGGGQLALLASALAARGIAEVVRPNMQMQASHIAVIGGGLLLVVLSCLYYASVSMVTGHSPAAIKLQALGITSLANVERITQLSLVLYVSAFVVGSLAVFVAHRHETKDTQKKKQK